MALNTASRAFMLLGQCVPCLKQNASKFRVKRLELDQNLLMYFRKDEFIYAHDPDKKCKTGDMVLIQQLPQKMTRLITHRVLDVVYPLGDTTDPLTGRKCVVGKYRDDVEQVGRVYGELASGFRYGGAPGRGWQEDRRDFSHVDVQVKYHETGGEQPHAA